ncbi:hypothetical protein RchiOBHm_Chr2g0151561 [Rosa chinensis]|uniref:Uncharacterized protein n=1 Tax=Rosa chinensis TaxID=74649 RepID=A0A2P6S096_ROSCH|nr:hypothetical protein RchiOBHm_Chr2g0151561 [Rosa chinensis]
MLISYCCPAKAGTSLFCCLLNYHKLKFYVDQCIPHCFLIYRCTIPEIYIAMRTLVVKGKCDNSVSF